MKVVTSFLLFLVLPIVGIILLLGLLNVWLLHSSLFGITFYGIDIRVILLGWFSIMAYVFLLLEVNDYLQFKKWRGSWK